MYKRVVITGIGLIAPNGKTTDEVWKSCCVGKGVVGRIPSHWARYWSMVSNVWAPLSPVIHDGVFVNRIEAMQIDKITLLALSAAAEAMKHAGLKLQLTDEKKSIWAIQNIDSSRWGTFIGTGMGGITSFSGAQSNHVHGAVNESIDEKYRQSVSELMRVPPRFNPFIVSMVMPNAPAAALGIKVNLTGYNKTYCQACAAGTVAIGEAFHAIQNGLIDGALAGGVEYLADEFGGIMRGFDIAKSLAVATEDISKANRPFDEHRTGFLFAEGGAGILVLESLDSARKRGVTPIAEIAGAAESFDAHSMMAMEPSGIAAENMIRNVLQQSGVQSHDIDYVNTHGTGTKLNDATESALIERIFGKKPIVNSTKSLIGHTIGASGAIETAITALSIRDSRIHPSLNIENPIADLSFARELIDLPVNTALTQSFAFGGHNACIVLKSVKV
jgi:3-oxoacyl-[acyl-carrier-protein] synthase II